MSPKAAARDAYLVRVAAMDTRGFAEAWTDAFLAGHAKTWALIGIQKTSSHGTAVIAAGPGYGRSPNRIIVNGIFHPRFAGALKAAKAYFDALPDPEPKPPREPVKPHPNWNEP